MTGPVSGNHKRYLVSDTLNGAATTFDGHLVDEQFVLSYTTIEARRFFINLGGTEQMRKTKSGIIECKSVSPDGKDVRVVRFAPSKSTRVLHP